MKSVVRSIVTLAALGLAGTVPCGVAGAAQAPPTAEKAPAAPARTAHGIVQMIGESLGEVTLTADQETIVEALGARVEPLQAVVDEAENALLLALADQIHAGHIDRAALEPQIAAYVSAREALAPELRDALDKLHDALDHEQRADLADALECRVHDVRRAIVSGEKTDELAMKLGLDDKQKASVNEILQNLQPGLETEREALHHAIEAFRDETFGLEKILPAADVPERARHRAEGIIDATVSISDILTPAQREQLAERLRQAAMARSDAAEDQPPAAMPGLSPKSADLVGEAADALWAAGFRRGPLGGVRGGVVVTGGAGRYYRGRVGAYPYAAGWGYGYY